MEKMTGPCTPDLFWSEVARIGWKDKNPRDFIAETEKDLLNRWDNDFTASFNVLFRNFKGALETRVEAAEQANGITCECGDDSFGDLMAHVIGLGKKEYEMGLEDPMNVIKRGREGKFTESFSYCIPHPRSPGPKLTLEDAKVKVLEALSPLEETEVEFLAYSEMLGDKAKLEPLYYAAWAKSELPNLQKLAQSAFASKFEDLSEVLEAVTEIAGGDLTFLLAPRGEELAKKVANLRKARAKVQKELMSDLEVLEPRGWGLDNLIKDSHQYLT